MAYVRDSEKSQLEGREVYDYVKDARPVSARNSWNTDPGAIERYETQTVSPDTMSSVMVWYLLNEHVHPAASAFLRS